MTKLLEQAADNLAFVAVSLLIAAALALAAWAVERVLPGKREVRPARRVTIVGICAAVATVLHILDFPLPFLAPDFYKLDFSEVPVMLCGFYLGPTAAVACEGVKIILKLLFKGTSTLFVGDFANFVVGCAFVLPAAVVYRLRNTKGGALAGLLLGTAVMTVFGSAFNAVYLLPKFAELYGMPLDAIIAMGGEINGGIRSVTSFVVLAVAPLNLIKGALITVLTMLLYKRVARPLFSLRA